MLSLLLVPLSLVAPVPKSQPIDLTWKFTKGEVLNITQHELRTTIVDLGDGLKLEIMDASVVVYELHVITHDAQTTTLEIRFVGGKHGSNGQIWKLWPDDIPNLAGRKVTITLDHKQAITVIKGAESPDDPLTALGIVREQDLRNRLNELLGTLPGKLLAESDTWDAEHQIELGDGIKQRRVERGQVGKISGVLTELTVEADIEQTFSVPNKPLSRLTGTTQPRKVLLDAKTGRVRKMTEMHELSGIVEDVGVGGAVKVPTTRKRAITITVAESHPKR